MSIDDDSLPLAATASVALGVYRTLFDNAMGTTAPRGRVLRHVCDSVTFRRIVEDTAFYWFEGDLRRFGGSELFSDVLRLSLDRCFLELAWELGLRYQRTNRLILSARHVPALQNAYNDSVNAVRAAATLRDEDTLGRDMQTFLERVNPVVTQLGKMIFVPDFAVSPTKVHLERGQPSHGLRLTSEGRDLAVKVPFEWGLSARVARPPEVCLTLANFLELLVGYVHEHLSHISLIEYCRNAAREDFITHGWLWHAQVQAVMEFLKKCFTNAAVLRCCEGLCRRNVPEERRAAFRGLCTAELFCAACRNVGLDPLETQASLTKWLFLGESPNGFETRWAAFQRFCALVHDRPYSDAVKRLLSKFIDRQNWDFIQRLKVRP